MSNFGQNSQAPADDVAYENSSNMKKEDNFDQFVSFSPVNESPANSHNFSNSQNNNLNKQHITNTSLQASIPTQNLTRPVSGLKADYNLERASSQTDLTSPQEVQSSMKQQPEAVPRIEATTETDVNLFLDDLSGLSSPSETLQSNHPLQFGQFNQAQGGNSAHSSKRGASPVQYDTPTFPNRNFTPPPPSLTIETPDEIRFTPPPEVINLESNIPLIQYTNVEAQYQQYPVQYHQQRPLSQDQNLNNDFNYLSADFSASAFQTVQPSSTALSEISSVENSPYLSAHSPSHFGDDLLLQSTDNYLEYDTIGQNLNAVDLSDAGSELSFHGGQQQYFVEEYRPQQLTQDNLTANSDRIAIQTPVTISIHADPQDRVIRTPSLFSSNNSSPNNSPVHSRAGSNNSQNKKSGFYSNLLSPHDTNSSAIDDDSMLLKPEDQQHASMRAGRQRRQSRSRSNSTNGGERERSVSANREKMLELASPNQSNKRVQKHPSIYACHLCDKRFTRPYNLKSHLRTHTDERPFVCEVCGKAFARQHDRKRHEDLHTGKKRYECRGVLRDGFTQWGCGKKFARTDALGRHFKTEAGKECIRPLVEEHDLEMKAKQENGTLTVPGDGQVRQFPDEIYNQFPSLLYGSQNNSGASDAGSDLE